MRKNSLMAAVAIISMAIGVSSFGPGVVQAAPVISFTDLGTVAPPATLGGYTMVPFSADGRALSANVSDVPDPAGTIIFSIPLKHVRPLSGWGLWSHGYTGDVYATGDSTSVTIGMPAGTLAFYLYAQPDPIAVHQIMATAQDGTTSDPVNVNGLFGAHGFGFHATDGAVIASITVTSSTAFGVGEFGIFVGDAAPPVVSCVPEMIAEATSPDGANVSWPTDQCTATDAAGGPLPCTYSSDAGAPFSIGTTTVRCSATDAAGNTGMADFSVIVQDTTPPVVSCSNGVGPSGKNNPNPNAGFRQVMATDAVGAVSIVIEGGTFVSDQLASGDYVKLTVAPGNPGSDVRPGPGVLEASITTNGQPSLVAMDAAGNTATVECGPLAAKGKK